MLKNTFVESYQYLLIYIQRLSGTEIDDININFSL